MFKMPYLGMGIFNALQNTWPKFKQGVELQARYRAHYPCHVNKNHAMVLLTSSNVIHVNFGTTNDHTVSI